MLQATRPLQESSRAASAGDGKAEQEPRVCVEGDDIEKKARRVQKAEAAHVMGKKTLLIIGGGC